MTTHRPQDATPTPEHDAVLLHALRHAPDPASPPSDTVRAHVLHHATQSIAIKAYASSGNGQKTSENTLKQGWLRLRNAIRIHSQRWGSARYTGAVASVMVAVLVGLLWHDDDRRAEGMEDSVAAASVPASAAQPETSVPASSVPQAEAAGPAQEQLARAKAATPALQERQELSVPKAKAEVKKVTPQVEPESQALALSDASEARRKRDNPSLEASGNVVAHAAPATQAAAAASRASPAPPMAAAPASSSAAAPPLARTAQGISDVVDAEQATATATAPLGATASLSQAIAQIQNTDPQSPDVVCRTQPAMQPAMQAATQPATQRITADKSTCHPAAANALLHSALLRRLLALAVPTSNMVLPDNTQQVQWRMQQTGAPPVATLGWSPSQRVLYWQTQAGQFSVTMNAQDAASVQVLVAAVAQP